MTIQCKPFYAGAAVALPNAAGNPISGISAEWLQTNFDQLTTKQARLEVTVGGAFQTGDTVVVMLVDTDVYNASTNPVALATASRVCSPNLTGSGPGVTDSGANALHGTLTGSPTLSSANSSILGSPFGQSVAFGGQTSNPDGISIAHSSLMNLATGTLEVRGVKRGRTGLAEVFAGVWAGSVVANNQYVLYFDGSGHVGGQIATSGSSAVLASTTTYDTSAAHDFALEWSGGTARIYADGVVVATGSYTGTINTGSSPFYIGRDGNASSDAFQGSIDEVQLSSVARYGGSSYTPASAPFVADANTVALYHLDSLTSPGAPSTNATFEIKTALLNLPSTKQNVGLVVYNQNGVRGNLLSAQIVGIG